MDPACATCAEIPDHSRRVACAGRVDGAMPPAASRLERVGRPHVPACSDRGRCLRRCPECGTYYEHGTDYEYLATGSEDEEWLTRLSDEVGSDRQRQVDDVVELVSTGIFPAVLGTWFVVKEPALEKPLRVWVKRHGVFASGIDLVLYDAAPRLERPGVVAWRGTHVTEERRIEIAMADGDARLVLWDSSDDKPRATYRLRR